MASSLKKIDAHQHFWHYSEAEFGWIPNEMSSIRRSFLPKDLEPALKENGFQGCVAVQAPQSEEETVFLLELANVYPFIKGVVGWVELTSPKVSFRLEEFCEDNHFKGVRHILQAEPEDDFMLRKDFKLGISKLEPLGLTYDLLLFPRHLPYAIELVDSFPNQRFVIDHLAKPFIKDGLLEPWASHLSKIAKRENVSCKISGMVTEAGILYWNYAKLKPYMEIALQAFGSDRLMFGSDWPVCLPSGNYREIVSPVTEFISSLSSSEQTAIMSLNATNFYNL